MYKCITLMFFWMALHISIAYGRRGWRKGASALRWRIRTWISARSSSNVASRSLDSDILLDTHWLIIRQDDRCIVKALLCVVSLFLALSPDCHWFKLVGTEFELTPPLLSCDVRTLQYSLESAWMIQFRQDGLNLPHFVWEAIQICLNQHLDVRLENSVLQQT